MNSNRYRWIMIGIAATSAVIINLDNVYISRMLRDRVTRTAVSPGHIFQAMGVENLDSVGDGAADEVVEFSTGFRKQLIFLISPTCQVCADNIPAWRDLEARVDREKYRIIVLATSGRLRNADVPGARFLREKIDMYRKAFDEPVRVIRERGDIVMNKLVITPQTILLNEKGRVEKVWIGRISSLLTQREIRNVLGLL